MISCDKAAIICNKAQYREATFMEKIKLRFHLFMCKTLHSLTEQEKLKMKQILDKMN